MPALADACAHLIAKAESGSAGVSDLIEAVESDSALAIAVMRAANNGNGPRGRSGGVPGAVESLGSDALLAIARQLETYDLLAPHGAASQRYEHFRRHAVAVACAARQVDVLAGLDQQDELVVAALLHDVGRLVLSDLYGPEFGAGHDPKEAPADRLRRERLFLGIDHALVGAVLIRRWGLPDATAVAVERHHSADATGLAATLRLADLVVHRSAGADVTPDSLRSAALALDLGEDELRKLLFEFPTGVGERRRQSEPCPLSSREVEALRGLAAGLVYKQIASELTLSVSTVRTHLHNVYRKIGAVDRAQAVLIARDRGWI